MGLFYECGQGLVPTQFARANFNMDVYLFSSGPSLADVDFSIFNQAPVYKVGINTTYPKFRPDLWMGLDFPKCFNDKLWHEPIPKITRMPFYLKTVGESSLPVKDCPMVYFADMDKDFTPHPEREVFRRRSHKTKFIWTNNTLTTALHILVWMGVKRIHLLGSDFGGEQDYFDDSLEARPFNHDKRSPRGSISKEQTEQNKKLYRQQIKFLRNFCEAGQRLGLEVISCTKSSPANSFLDYLDLPDALSKSISRVEAKLKS